MRVALAVLATSSVLATPLAAAAADPTESVVMGAMKDPAHTQQAQDAKDAKTPTLPVVYEYAKAPTSQADSRAPQHRANETDTATPPPLKPPASS